VWGEGLPFVFPFLKKKKRKREKLAYRLHYFQETCNGFLAVMAH